MGGYYTPRRKKRNYPSKTERDAHWWKGFRKAIYHPDHKPWTDIDAIDAGMNGQEIHNDTPAEMRSFADGFKCGQTFIHLYRKQASNFPDLERHLAGGSGMERGVEQFASKVAEVASDPFGEAGDVVDFFLQLG